MRNFNARLVESRRIVADSQCIQTLGDEKKRTAFDKYGAAAQQPGFSEEAYARASSSPFGGGFGGFEDLFGGRGGSAGPGQGSPADIFESMFGGGFGARPGAARPGASQGPGEDLQTTIRIPFLEACKGTVRVVDIAPVVECPTCTGTGMKAGAKAKTCQTCNGSGMQQFIIQNGFAMSTTCQSCRGTGSRTDPKDSCSGCGGVGKVRTSKKVEVKILAGVDDGMRLTMPGMGDVPLEGKGRPGDLHVRIEVVPSKNFRRQGANLYHSRTVPFHTAILGGRVTVNTLEEDVQVRVPQGTQPGEEMVLRGRGVQKLNRSDRGDLFVRFNVTLPRSLSPRQRELLEEYVDDLEGRPSQRQKVAEATASGEADAEPSSKEDSSSDTDQTTTPETKDESSSTSASSG